MTEKALKRRSVENLASVEMSRREIENINEKWREM